MNPRGGPYGQWPAHSRSGPSSGRFLPTAGTFSDQRQPIGYPAQTPSQPSVHGGPGPAHHFFPPQQVYNGPPTIPIADAEFAQAQANFPNVSFQGPLNGPLWSGEPVVHEGFVPAPGRENDDLLLDTFDTTRYGDDYETSSEESDSDDERFIYEPRDRDDDKDFSLSENELEDDPEDMEIGDADFSDEERAPKRAKPKTRGTPGRPRGRPRSVGRGGFQNVSRRGRKPGTRGRPPGKRGPQNVADPGPEFKELQRLANEAYMREDFETALKHAKDAIKLNPEIFPAHSLVSEIYAAMGDEQNSVWSLCVGAPTKRDKELWLYLLDRIDQVDSNKFPEMDGKMKDRMKHMCLTSVIRIDSEDWDARYLKFEIDARRKRYSSCVLLCRKMLKIRPHDVHILSQMAQLGTANEKQTRLHAANIIKDFDFSINHFIQQGDRSENGLGWTFLNVYLELLVKVGDYNHALSRLKFLSRWIQKRTAETYWDNLDDDREFDVDDFPRRIAVPEFVQQLKKRRRNYGKSLPLQIKVKLGIYRLLTTPPNFEEAMLHLNFLDPEDDSEEGYFGGYPDCFNLAAKTLYATEHYGDAIRFYEPLRKHGVEQDLDGYIGMYTCYKNVGDTETVETILPILKDWKDATLQNLATLAKFFEDQGMVVEAMQRAEIVFKNRSSWRLRSLKFQQYDELRRHFLQVRKIARGRHGTKKTRARKYIRKLKAATRNEVDSDQEDDTSERPSLGPLGERPKAGLFRTRKQLQEKLPQTFMPIEESDTLEGTQVPLLAIDHSLFREKLNFLATKYADELTAARAQHREITASFARLQDICDDADNGDPAASNEYMSIARELIEEFSTFDVFYSNRKHGFGGYFRRLGTGDLYKDSALMVLAVEANRAEDGEEGIELKERPDTVPQDFFGVHFDKWAEVFCRFALLLARQGAEGRCFNVLDVALQSNVFHKSKEYTCDMELCRLACALAVDDSRQVSAAIRYLLKAYPFGTEIFRLYGLANRLCSIPDGYATGATYKVAMRWIKTVDYALLEPNNRAWYNFQTGGGDRTQWMQHSFNPGTLDHVKGHDPALFALFGHVVMCTGSYTTALNYFYRAFAITPEDPTLNLSIGIAYFQHAQKRSSENRQFQIQQGIAFVTRYHDLRTKDKVAIHEQEAEFNVGRVFHGLGLVSQAIPYYNRCIALSERVKQEANMRDGNVEDFATEAAYALQTIYVLSGDFESAFDVTMANLVIE